MSGKYTPGEIIKKEREKQIKCCLHRHLVPLEIGFASKTWPQGYKAEPLYMFAVGLINSNIIRVKSYLCLDCKQEIKAPNPGQVKKDRL
jgi:hypothetical protein